MSASANYINVFWNRCSQIHIYFRTPVYIRSLNWETRVEKKLIPFPTYTKGTRFTRLAATAVGWAAKCE